MVQLFTIKIIPIINTLAILSDRCISLLLGGFFYQKSFDQSIYTLFAKRKERNLRILIWLTPGLILDLKFLSISRPFSSKHRIANQADSGMNE